MVVLGTMPEVKSLIVFYSRTGTTRKAAGKISNLLKSDIEEVIDMKKRAGALGWFISGIDAALKRLTVIKEAKNGPASYDVVVLGTPVWAGTMSSPIRTFISQNKGHLRKVAFFCTCGDSGKAALEALEDLYGSKPVASLELKTKEVVKEEYIRKCEVFVKEIDRASART